MSNTMKNLASGRQPRAGYYPDHEHVTRLERMADGITELVAHLDRCRVGIELGPVERTGVQGAMMSVYIRDPDNNLIELSVYSS